MGEVLSQPQLAARLAELAAAGRRIAFANGHFDLLHVGHLRYLRAAKSEVSEGGAEAGTAAGAQAGVLVVGINGDASVRRRKGPGRPLVPAAERAELVAGLEPVDFAVVFEEDSPAALLSWLRPDVHCKGPDYGSPQAVPEYEVVRAYGGRTVLVGDPKDHATSELVGRIRRLAGAGGE
ncbi:MAG: adenylyltransferase/cytidyltransferase family protein [Acidobacteria bacterium]|nr:adenylyltransferase/cytidyltransferase family protein [Acidobacteriota bacterium]